MMGFCFVINENLRIFSVCVSFINASESCSCCSGQQGAQLCYRSFLLQLFCALNNQYQPLTFS